MVFRSTSVGPYICVCFYETVVTEFKGGGGLHSRHICPGSFSGRHQLVFEGSRGILKTVTPLSSLWAIIHGAHKERKSYRRHRVPRNSHEICTCKHEHLQCSKVIRNSTNENLFYSDLAEIKTGWGGHKVVEVPAWAELPGFWHFTVQEALVLIFQDEEADRDLAEYVSVWEDIMEENSPLMKMTEVAEQVASLPHHVSGRTAVENVVWMTSGPTWPFTSHASDILWTLCDWGCF